MKRVKVVFVLMVAILSFEMVDAQRGCCSHHKGVAGCSSDGRTICKDGTYSESCTCTPPKVYGCTDWNAINYNNNANTDNGSCRYEKIEYEDVIIEYETEIQNPNNIEHGKETIIQEGQYGEKSIKYTIIVDSKGNQISKEKDMEVMTKKPINQIILIEETKTEKQGSTTVIKTANNNDENSDSESDEQAPEDTVIGIAVIGGIALGYKKYKKNKKNKTLVL